MTRRAKPITSAAQRLLNSPVGATLTGAQTLDIIMLLKEHARAAAQRAKKGMNDE